MPIFKLDTKSNLFPPPALANYDGLLAYGGDLSIERLLNAYRSGIFPWYNPVEQILWWAPRRRFVIFPEEIHVSRSMKKFLQKNSFETKINADFSQIIKNCRKIREGQTWIGDDMENAYNALFDAGYVLCAGVYERSEVRGKNTSDCLIGGLYGVVIGRCFFGESMFSLAPNGSKIALIELCRVLAEKKFAFIDCQFHTPHLERMGGRFIEWEIFNRLLRENLSYPQVF